MGLGLSTTIEQHLKESEVVGQSFEIKNPHLHRDDTMSPAARRWASQYPVFLVAPFMPQPVPFVGSGWLAVGAT